MLKLAGEFYPGPSAVAATDTALAEKTSTGFNGSRDSAFEILQIIGVTDLFSKFSAANGALLGRSAKYRVGPLILPCDSILVGIPVPNAEPRRFGGESKPVLRSLYGFASLNLTGDVTEIANHPMAALGQRDAADLPFKPFSGSIITAVLDPLRNDIWFSGLKRMPEPLKNFVRILLGPADANELLERKADQIRNIFERCAGGGIQL